MTSSRLLVTLFCIVSFLACQPSDKSQAIIEQAIEAHGGDAYSTDNRISFDFRKYHVVLTQKQGQFRYERTFKDSTGATIHDVLTNTSFARTINNQVQVLDTAQIGKYSRAVNSVAYFVLLPLKLRDPAVQATYLGEADVDGQRYDKVQVRFRAAGGGKDHGDTFCYWFNKQTHTMDYLAYSEEGPRFRKAINPQVVGGIRFQDYINYKSNDSDTTFVGNYDTKYTARQLPELSRIEQKNIRVE